MISPGVILTNTFESFQEKMNDRSDIELPARQFIQVGDVVYDEPQFCVHTMSGPYQGKPGQPFIPYSADTGGVMMLAMNFGVTIVRSFPVSDNRGGAPKPIDLTAYSLQAANDALVLQQTFNEAAADNSILGACDTIYWSGIEWVGPLGGTLGTRLNFAAQL